MVRSNRKKKENDQMVMNSDGREDRVISMKKGRVSSEMERMNGK